MSVSRVLITGSSRGIGAAIAEVAVRDGWKVILHGKSESEDLLRLSKRLAAEYIVCDLNSTEQISHAMGEIDSLDCLVNNAGINISKRFMELSERDWNEVYQTNLFGLISVTKAAIPKLKQDAGKKNLPNILNISSVKGINTSVGRVAYASSKAAVMNVTAGLAKELAPEVRVNGIAPGFISSDMTEETWSDRIERQVASIPLKRMGSVDEIAEVAGFLISSKCSYLTGQTLIVDGGFSIQGG